eukprot:2129030-Rhodomonas_salina.2
MGMNGVWIDVTVEVLMVPFDAADGCLNHEIKSAPELSELEKADQRCSLTVRFNPGNEKGSSN